MNDINTSQLQSYNVRMLKPPFLCVVCKKKSANITTIDLRCCLNCFWQCRKK